MKSKELKKAEAIERRESDLNVWERKQNTPKEAREGAVKLMGVDKKYAKKFGSDFSDETWAKFVTSKIASAKQHIASAKLAANRY